MRPLLPTLLAVAGLVAATTACGDLSQEDLLFRAALPSKSELELLPAGAASTADASSGAGQALARACDDADLHCQSLKVAEELNGLTFGLLDVVDFVTAHPPSERARGRRVWGPYFDADKDVTSRFEMVRRRNGVTYDFCLHATAGRVRGSDARDLSCDVDVHEETGLAVVLSGFFTPGELAGARARSGEGGLTLELGRLPDHDGVGRRLEFRFNNREARTDIEVTLVGARVPGTVTEREPVHYAFTRETDGSGTFLFDVLANIVKDSPRLEQLLIVAEWNAEQAGRADGSVSGGDAGPGVTVAQCWDTAGDEVFHESTFTEPRGDVGACVIADSLLSE